MYNFYQSQLRKNINKYIYKKPVWEVVLFWYSYQYIIREKKKFWISLCWLQILGIQDLQHHTLQEWKEELKSLQKKHNPIHIQLGCIDLISKTDYQELKDHTLQQTIYNERQKIISSLVNSWFNQAIKENLPPSTYIISLEDYLPRYDKLISSQHKTNIKKAIKIWVTIRQATTQEDKEWFFLVLMQTGKKKGFWTINQKLYTALLDHIEKNNCGELYIATIGNTIVAWAVYLEDYESKTAIYLYGGTNRSYWNTGASQLLHYMTWEIIHKKGIQYIDLLGGPPTWDTSHHLHNVWIFKEQFGWKKYDYIWSFDIVYKPLLYSWRKLLRK